MATPTTDKLRLFLPSKYLAADGDPLTAFVADAGSIARDILCAALTQATGYWNGAIGWFTGDTLTADLQGIFFHVKESDVGTVTLSRDLPAAPQAGDSFRLVLGGNWRSSTELFGMKVAGYQPELSPVAGVNITGLTIKKASATLGEGNITVKYDSALAELYLATDGDFGPGLSVATDVVDGIVFEPEGMGYIQVDVVAASLPGTLQTDLFTLTTPLTTFTPDFEGYETENDVGGKTRYRLEVVKNEDPVDTMVDLSVRPSLPEGDATTVDTGGLLNENAGELPLLDCTGWPTTSFWIKNTTADDCRYVNYRSGNLLYCAAVDWSTLSFTGGSVAILPGDVIFDPVNGASAVVDQVGVTSGDWATSDAAGTLTLKKCEGVFGDTHSLEVEAVPVATASGDSMPSLRGYIATTWNAGDSIELMAEVDLGLDAGVTGQFQDPASEAEAPAGVAFTDAPLVIGDLVSSATYGVWRREWIMAKHRARADIPVDTLYSWS